VGWDGYSLKSYLWYKSLKLAYAWASNVSFAWHLPASAARLGQDNEVDQEVSSVWLEEVELLDRAMDGGQPRNATSLETSTAKRCLIDCSLDYLSLLEPNRNIAQVVRLAAWPLVVEAGNYNQHSATMNSLQDIQQFRNQIFQNLGKGRNAFMDLMDAVLTSRSVSSLGMVQKRHF
jgi:hypothetical protein